MSTPKDAPYKAIQVLGAPAALRVFSGGTFRRLPPSIKRKEWRLAKRMARHLPTRKQVIQKEKSWSIPPRAS